MGKKVGGTGATCKVQASCLPYLKTDFARATPHEQKVATILRDMAPQVCGCTRELSGPDREVTRISRRCGRGEGGVRVRRNCSCSSFCFGVAVAAFVQILPADSQCVEVGRLHRHETVSRLDTNGLVGQYGECRLDHSHRRDER